MLFVSPCVLLTHGNLNFPQTALCYSCVMHLCGWFFMGKYAGRHVVLIISAIWFSSVVCSKDQKSAIKEKDKRRYKHKRTVCTLILWLVSMNATYLYLLEQNCITCTSVIYEGCFTRNERQPFLNKPHFVWYCLTLLVWCLELFSSFISRDCCIFFLYFCLVVVALFYVILVKQTFWQFLSCLKALGIKTKSSHYCAGSFKGTRTSLLKDYYWADTVKLLVSALMHWFLELGWMLNMFSIKFNQEVLTWSINTV